MDERDLLAIMCNLFCQGHQPSEIRDILADQYHVQLKRTAIYPKLKQGCMNGWISFTPPAEVKLAEALRARYRGVLQGVAVATGPTNEGVAYHAARELGRLIREVHAEKQRDATRASDPGVHLGLSGGYTLRLLSEYFADYLIQTFVDGDDRERAAYGAFPAMLHLHAMVAGFDPFDPTTEPNAMFTHLHLVNQVPTQMKFVGFNAPPVVRRDQIEKVKKLPQIQTSFDQASRIEIAITSMGAWTDPDCMLHKCMKQFPDDFDKLTRAGVIGDLMWRPLGPDGPLNGVTDVQTMSVMDLRSLARLIGGGGRVVLVVARTRKQKSKADVLKQLLAYDRPLVSHLVVDSLTAQELLV